MQSCFDEVKKNFGFGCMRLPMKGKEVDFEETAKMVDMFLANGFNYFAISVMTTSASVEEARL